MPASHLTPDELTRLAAPIYASMLAVSASDDNPAKPDYKGLMSEALEHAMQLHEAATHATGQHAGVAGAK